ncbi:hypothetical protein OB13_00350 [Pontibacter sp. HJ8]
MQAQEAAGKIQTERPDQTESVKLVPGRSVQLEIGYQFQKNSTQGFDAKLHAYPSALLRFGVLDWLEMRLEGAVQDSIITNGSRRKVTGYGPISLGGKVVLWEEQGLRPKAALLLMVALPVASRDFRPENPEPEVRLALANQLTDKIELAYNLMYGRAEGNNEAGYNLALYGDLTDKFTAFAEVFGSKAETEEAEHQADAGLMFFPRPNLQLDVAAGIGFNKAAPDYFLAAGLALRLPH